MNRPRIISICGNIGCGKSTVLRLLKKRFSCMLEAISDWKVLLEKFYLEPEKYFMALQLRIISDQTLQKEQIEKMTEKFVFIERSTDDGRKVFINVNKEMGIVDDLMVDEIDRWIKVHEMGIQPDITIYLENNPENSLERISHRAHPGDENISLDYLSQLHKYYQMYYKDKPEVICMNSQDKTPVQLYEEILTLLGT